MPQLPPVNRSPASALVGDSPARALGLEINRKLAGSPMAGTGPTFVSAAARNDVNPWFLVAIAKVESQLGTTGFATNGSHNPFGLGVTGAAGAGFRYTSWSGAINAAADNLGGPLYRGAGLNTIAKVGGRWAADPGWPTKVAAAYSSLAGGASIRTDRVVIGPGRAGVQPDPNTSPGDALGNLAGAVTDPLSGLVGLVARLFDPSTWLRVLAALGGTIAIVLGILFLFRSRTARRA